jgi:hypothetical protein
MMSHPSGREKAINSLIVIPGALICKHSSHLRVQYFGECHGGAGHEDGKREGGKRANNSPLLNWLEAIHRRQTRATDGMPPTFLDSTSMPLIGTTVLFAKPTCGTLQTISGKNSNLQKRTDAMEWTKRLGIGKRGGDFTEKEAPSAIMMTLDFAHKFFCSLEVCIA